MAHIPRYLLLFALILLFLQGCSARESANVQNDTDVERRVLLISETLPNVHAPDSASIDYFAHDSTCRGFYRQHFDPAVIQPSHFAKGGIAALEEATGLSWRRVATKDSIVDFNELFDDTQNRIVYVAEQINSKREEDIVLSAGSDDGFMLYVNGDSLYTHHAGRALKRNDDLVRVHLEKGSNIFLYKVDQGTGGWALYRRFVKDNAIDALFGRLASELYADMPESAIIPDTAGRIPLKQDTRRHLDAVHTVYFEWMPLPGFSGKHELQPLSVSYTAASLPPALELPQDYPGAALLEVRVEGEAGRLSYREYIPIFSTSTAKELARVLSEREEMRGDDTNPTRVARRAAVRILFGLDNDKGRSYSTRLKAHALADLLRYRDKQQPPLAGPAIYGYRSSLDSTVQTYRVYLPAPLDDPAVIVAKNQPLVFLSYGVLADSSLWMTKEGASHALTMRRMALSTRTSVIIAQPHGHGKNHYVEDFFAIAGNLGVHGLTLDSTDAAILVYSLGMTSLLDAMLKAERKMPFRQIGAISPIFPSGDTRRRWLVRKLKERYPDLQWFIRHGMLDTDAPIHATRRWVRALQEAGFEVDYKEMPYASHWNYFSDPEKEFYIMVAETL